MVSDQAFNIPCDALLNILSIIDCPNIKTDLICFALSDKLIAYISDAWMVVLESQALDLRRNVIDA